ncbi:MAG: hypothetical protein ACOYVF_06795 [Candidatus Zixiibacteriota bacterium]
MKKILLICYYFPPLGLGGVGRPLNLFKKLPAYGYDCHILTVKPVTYRAYEPELLEGLDTGKIFRSGSHDPQRLMYLLGVRRVTERVLKNSHQISEKFFPDAKVGWVKAATRLGRTLHTNYRYDAFISTSPPVSSHLVARQLAYEFDIPWIADFRDFWSSYKVEETFADQKNIDKGRRLLSDIKKEAAAVTAVNPTIAGYLQTGEVITNGYDCDLAEGWRTACDSEHFCIGLLGHQHESKAVAPLLNLLREFGARSPEKFGRIKIVQVGQVDPEWFLELLKEYDLRERCEIHGVQKRAETIRILSRAALFYIGLDADREQKILPARMFDLLASGRPILAYVSAKSEIARLLEETRTGMRFDDENKNEALAYFERVFEEHQNGKLVVAPLSEAARRYSSEAMVERFAGLLDKLI